jgi:hypothetical protein
VELHVAVEQCIAGVVGYEVDSDSIQRHHIDNILPQAGEILVADTCDFKSMPVQVHRMLIG